MSHSSPSPPALTSSNITDHVSFLFTSLSKYFIASYHPISRCLFRLVKIASSNFTTEKERLFPAFVFVRPLAVVERPPPGVGSRPILYGCDDATVLCLISSRSRASVLFLVWDDFLMVGRAVGHPLGTASSHPWTTAPQHHTTQHYIRRQCVMRGHSNVMTKRASV